MELKDSVLGVMAVLALASCVNAGYTKGCFKYCPHGQVLDAHKCACFTEKVYQCPQLKCVTGPFACKAYKKDARGCSTCECLDRCFRSRCPRTCRGGVENYVDEKGCPACRCKQQPVCNHFKCAVYCPHGNVKDHFGCDTCQCKPAPCGSGCNMACTYGRVINSNGCELCECKPKPLCGPVCANNCHHGRVMDSYGCPTCQCLLG